jgi:hypothetical protein
MNLPEIIAENKKRWDVLNCEYNPFVGIGSPIKRIPFHLSKDATINIPESMLENEYVQQLVRYDTFDDPELLKHVSISEANTTFLQLRCKHDFEFWAASCVKIQTKEHGIQPFILNLPQRILLSIFEEMRLAGVPIRVILLKHRQWGGSTLTQLYIAWIQLYHKTDWNALVISDVKEKSLHIRAMYMRMAQHHPQNMIPDIEEVELVPYEKTQNYRMIVGRNNIIGVSSVETPEAPRAFTLHLLHLSEVGSWKSTEVIKAEELAQSMYGSLVDAPYTLCVKESTAKGVGNYFHREWQRASKKESNDRPVFVEWFRDPQYKKEVSDVNSFVNSWSDYERFLWARGATIEHIYWYREKKKDFDTDWHMRSEYPTTAEEAFISSGSRIFAVDRVETARKTCISPVAVGTLLSDAHRGKDAFKNIRFEENPKGNVFIWKYPHKVGIEKPGKIYTNRYCAFGDVGGRTEDADYHSITVLDRIYTLLGGVPYVCAEFHGHMDQDLFAWIGAKLCYWYGKALFAVEINSLKRTGDPERGYDVDHSYTVLDEIKDYYDNLYYRIRPESAKENWSGLIGFHTNEATKAMIIDSLNGALRDEGYEEKNLKACDEFDLYELKVNGKMGARDGKHDDRVISRAGAYWLHTTMGAVQEVDAKQARKLTAKPGHVAIFT